MVLISAHRGGSEHASPATYEAYKHALLSGAEYAEFDIRKTLDNVLVVHRDARAARTGPLVKDLTYKELCDRLSYIVPKVGEVMDLLAGKMMGHLDLKEIGYEEEVIRLASLAFGRDSFIATTPADESITAIKRSFPSVRTALALGRDLNKVPRELYPVSRLRKCGADWAAVNYRLARLGVINACKRNGVGIMIWTVDQDALIDQFLIDERINVLITNRPEHAVRRRTQLTSSVSNHNKIAAPPQEQQLNPEL